MTNKEIEAARKMREACLKACHDRIMSDEGGRVLAMGPVVGVQILTLGMVATAVNALDPAEVLKD